MLPPARKDRRIPKVYEPKTPCNSPTTVQRSRPTPCRPPKLTKPTHALLTIGTQTDVTCRDPPDRNGAKAKATRPPTRPCKATKPQRHKKLARGGRSGKSFRLLKKRKCGKQKRLRDQLREAEALRASNEIIAWAQHKREARARAEELRRLRNEGIVEKTISRAKKAQLGRAARVEEIKESEHRAVRRPEKPASGRAASRQRGWAFRKIYRVDDAKIERTQQRGSGKRDAKEPVLITSLDRTAAEVLVPVADELGEKKKRKKVSRKGGRKAVKARSLSSAGKRAVGKRAKGRLAGTAETSESVSEKLLAMDLFEEEDADHQSLWECASCRFSNAANETCCALCGAPIEPMKETTIEDSHAEAPRINTEDSGSEYSVDDFA